MTRRRPATVERLLGNVRWALAHGLGPRDLVPMLDNLARRAEAGSDTALFAKRELAGVLAGSAPWRAARLCLDVLEYDADDAQAWSVLALAHSMLGNYRCSRKAYLRARRLAPDCAATAHNLGHLLDVAFDSPRAALPHLLAAYRLAPDEVEIAGSYAHALLRAGRPSDAGRVLSEALPGDPARVAELLSSWQTPSPSAAHRAAPGVRGEPSGTPRDDAPGTRKRRQGSER